MMTHESAGPNDPHYITKTSILHYFNKIHTTTSLTKLFYSIELTPHTVTKCHVKKTIIDASLNK